MHSATIGYMRCDGDFAVLATLDNGGEEYSTEVFDAIVHTVREKLQSELEDEIEILPDREDAVAILEGGGSWIEETLRRIVEDKEGGASDGSD